jgi:hypothetical protein
LTLPLDRRTINSDHLQDFEDSTCIALPALAAGFFLSSREGANEFHVELCTIMVFCRPNQVIGRRDSCSCRPERSDRPEE